LNEIEKEQYYYVNKTPSAQIHADKARQILHWNPQSEGEEEIATEIERVFEELSSKKSYS
jgi:hypothetical protein